MSLSWRDAAATLLVAVVVAIAYAKIKGVDWPIIGNWRLATLAIVIIGLGTCIAIGSGATPTQDTWTGVATTLGAIAFVLAAAGLILNNQTIFLVLAADIVTLWVVTTIHHLVVPGT